MMPKIQKFGGAMFTPVLLFAFAGISVGIGTLFTTQAIMGGLAAPTSMWYKCWNVFLQGGWTVFNQLPLLFAAFYSTAKPEKKKKSFSERYFRKYRSSNFCWNLYVCDVTIKIIVI